MKSATTSQANGAEEHGQNPYYDEPQYFVDTNPQQSQHDDQQRRDDQNSAKCVNDATIFNHDRPWAQGLPTSNIS
ncbi:MAG: hypothetical protein R3C09_13825 [Pirellulaceae bacterium]